MNQTTTEKDMPPLHTDKEEWIELPPMPVEDSELESALRQLEQKLANNGRAEDAISAFSESQWQVTREVLGPVQVRPDALGRLHFLFQGSNRGPRLRAVLCINGQVHESKNLETSKDTTLLDTRVWSK